MWVALLTICVAILFWQFHTVRKELTATRQRLDRLVNELKAASKGEFDPDAVDLSEDAPLPTADAPAPKPAAAKPAPIAYQEPFSGDPWAAAKAGDMPPLPPSAFVEKVDDTPKSVVFRADMFDRLVAWAKANTFYAISAISLALAGIFLVQYSISNGLLPPFMRVMLGLAFGGAFLLAGEYIRRKYGHSPSSSTAYLPSIFSGVGVVTLFASFGAARVLYELLPPNIALLGLVGTSVLAVVLGWLHGPLLVAIGLLGAFAAPFVAGGSGDTTILFAYFAVMTAVGLFVDAMRRWAWVSVLALSLGALGGVVTAFDTETLGDLTIYLLLLTGMAVMIPRLEVIPGHKGPTVTEAMLGIRVNGVRWPEFPTRLAAGMVWVTALVLTLLSGVIDGTTVWIVFPALGLLMAAFAVGGLKARALSDLILPVAGAFIAMIVLSAAWFSPVFDAYREAARAAAEGAVDANPGYVSGIALVAVVVTLAAAWRATTDRGYPVLWAAFATLFSPVVLIALHLFWEPATVQGRWDWALHVIFLAALMTFLAERFWRAEEMEDRKRTALAALSALSLIAFSFFILMAQAPLTLALAAMIAIAAVLDRQFGLRLLSVYISVGVVVLGYRLIVDPGIDWARTAPLLMVLLSYGGAIAAMFGAHLILRDRHRPTTKILLTSGAWAACGVFANILLYRAIEAAAGPGSFVSHWGLSLTGSIWLIVALTQIFRLQTLGNLRFVRIGFATVAGFLALASYGMGLFILSPIADPGELVLGPWVFDTLLVAYVNPAILLIAASRMEGMPRWVRQGGLAVAGVLILAYVFLEIRHMWRGDVLAVPGFEQGELYTYTMVLLVIGAGLLVVSLIRQDGTLRKAGLVVIGLAVAKVFLVDISGLEGLARVFSFLALGLSLAGLAWLNRWIEMRISDGPPDDTPPDDGSPKAPDPGGAAAKAADANAEDEDEEEELRPTGSGKAPKGLA